MNLYLNKILVNQYTGVVAIAGGEVADPTKEMVGEVVVADVFEEGGQKGPHDDVKDLLMDEWKVAPSP